MSSWQPMDSAPKDGTEVLICVRSHSKYGVVISRTLAFWSSRDEVWTDGEWLFRPSDVLHWAPLPSVVGILT